MKIATGMQNPFPKSIQEMMHNKIVLSRDRMG